MKTRLLRKLRAQAKKKYSVEPYVINDKLMDYRIIMNDKQGSKILFHHPYLDEAVVMRDNLRRNDMIQQVGIIRYRKTIKRFK